MHCCFLMILEMLSVLTAFPKYFFDNDSIRHEKQDTLSEVVITGNYPFSVISIDDNNSISISPKVIKRIPSILGNSDIFNASRLLSGVSTNNTFDAGWHVRGGESSHNMVAFNGATIYNPEHLFGLYSTINTDHISNFYFSKNNQDARLGSRLGGSMIVESPNTLLDSVNGNLAIGLISSQFHLGAPISNKSTLYLSARRSYITPIMGLVIPNYEIGYDFTDLNATVVTQQSKHSSFLLNFYYGNDFIFLKDYQLRFIDADIKWSNILASFVWNYSTDALQQKHSLYTSQYECVFLLDYLNVAAKIPSRINDTGYKWEMTIPINNHIEVEAGIDFVAHHVETEKPQIDYIINERISDSTYLKQDSYEGAAYAEFRYHSSRWDLSAGLRYSSILYGRTTTGGLEPRIKACYYPGKNSSIQFSYGMHRQYISQISLSSNGLPINYWVSTSKDYKQQYGHSLNVGYSLRIEDFAINTTAYLNLYYNQLEKMSNIYDMIKTDYSLTNNLYSGRRESYGIELSAQYIQPHYTLSIAYTLGWAWGIFDGINGGRRFRSNHDRRHDLSIVALFSPWKRWEFSGSFTFAAGNAYTKPVSLALIGENVVYKFGDYNNGTMPSYRRLDLSADYRLNSIFHGKVRQHLTFSIYNTLLNNNPVIMTWSAEELNNSQSIKLLQKKKSFFTIIPSISYTITL